MDIDHLQAVHGRKLREPPTFQRLDQHRVRLSYRARVTGSHLSDRMMKWLSNDEIHTCVTCVGGSMLLVESLVGRHRSFVILSMCPAGRAGATLRAVAGVAGAPSRLTVRMSVSVAAWLFHAFLKKDVGILQQMDWHEPAVEATLGDTLMRRLCKFFRSLPEFTLASGQPLPKAATLGTAAESRSPPRVVNSGRGI